MPSLVHKPVMLTEVLDALRPRSGLCYLDGTVGAGGHSRAILEAAKPDGRLYGCDRDSSAIQIATERLAEFSGRFELRVGNFSELADWIGRGECDGAVLDLGISSIQLDDPTRGFSFQADGILDMRMNREQSMTAAQIINEAPSDELARIFWEFGGERQSRRLARIIEQERKLRTFETTRQLATLIECVMPRHGQRIHPATRVFMALRIAVNDEAEILKKDLNAIWTVLKRGARLAIVTFQSLEDRIVKEFGRKLERDYEVEGDHDIPDLRRPKLPELKWVSKKALAPTEREISENPRARSAKLRAMEKI